MRQREMLQLLAEVRSMKEVAYHLNVTPSTVAFHTYTMMDQLKAQEQRRVDPVCDEELDLGGLGLSQL